LQLGKVCTSTLLLRFVLCCTSLGCRTYTKSRPTLRYVVAIFQLRSLCSVLNRLPDYTLLHRSQCKYRIPQQNLQGERKFLLGMNDMPRVLLCSHSTQTHSFYRYPRGWHLPHHWPFLSRIPDRQSPSQNLWRHSISLLHTSGIPPPHRHQVQDCTYLKCSQHSSKYHALTDIVLTDTVRKSSLQADQ
jgi:hypothetical protein